MPVRVRLAADLPACVRALARVHVHDGYPNQWPCDPQAWLNTPTLVAAWVATRGDSIKGHIALETNVTDPILAAATGRPLGRLAKVSRLFVQPSARGDGMGQALLAEAADYALGQDLATVLDVVDDATFAIALYERLGWQLVDRQPAHWTVSDGSHPLMRRYALL